MTSFGDRVIGAATLNLATYEEVEADREATAQAMGVVLLSSVAAAVGNSGHWGRELVARAALALVAWLVWAFVVYFIGTRLLEEPQTRSDVGELLRTTGFASAPGIACVLGIIPFVGSLVVFVASVWMVVTTVVAVRQALDYQSTGRAVAVCLIGFVPYAIAMWIASPIVRSVL